MKTDEACTRRGMWCASEMKRQRNELDEVNVTLRALGMFCKQLQLPLSHNIDEVTLTLAVKGTPNPEDKFTVTYTTILAFCADHEDFLFGLQLHSLIFKSGLDGEVFVGNALISMYSRLRRLIEARSLFDEMANGDLVSRNAILSGYSQEGNHGLGAIIVFIEMVGEGMGLDHVSFTSAVSACGHEMNLELGKQIHGLTIKSGYGMHDDRNVVSWTTMISIDEEDAISLFNEMRLDGVYPNDVTFVGLIHAISIRKLVEEGEMIHGFCIKTGFLSKHNVCNSLITMYAKLESMHDSINGMLRTGCVKMH
ncbi:unnamed protein product [Prunus armeniaca]